MKKQISFSTKGQRADIGDLIIYRILANRYADAVGPFVFLDHIAPKEHPSVMESGTGAHPHRGIATLSYIIEGEDEHFDSAGNYAKVYSGGVQWMKAGNGIIHDETLNIDSQTDTKRIHAFQFWINLPSKIKAEKPEYMAIPANEVPQKMLPDEAGWIKVIAGTFEELSSKIPNYSDQFLYHIKVKSGRKFSLSINNEIEVAAFLPTADVILNDSEHKAAEFVEFGRDGSIIEIVNEGESVIDLLLFGGARYEEPIIAEGPFVMNTRAEIADAYRDFSAGKYGEIDYNKYQK